MGRSGKFKTPEYVAWNNMRTRCNWPGWPQFHHYGGRGIRVCEQWDSFDLFLSDMGPRPSSGHSLDRINNDGNYEKSNCKWSTRSEQNANRRSKGEDSPVHRLTEAQVLEMRRLRAETGALYNVLARQFGVSTMTAYRAATGQSWAYLKEK